MFVFFMWILWFWLLFTVFGDLFRRHDISGWAKAGWTFFVIILPFLGDLHLPDRRGEGHGRAEHEAGAAEQADMDTYVRSVAGSADAAAQIAKGKELLDSGAITQAEYDQLKAKALAA